MCLESGLTRAKNSINVTVKNLSDIGISVVIFAERMRFGGYLIVAFLLSALIYPLYGHWAWNGVVFGSREGWPIRCLVVQPEWLRRRP